MNFLRAKKDKTGGSDHVNSTERQMDAAINAGEGEVERLAVQKKLVCKTMTSAMVDLRDFVLAAEGQVCLSVWRIRFIF